MTVFKGSGVAIITPFNENGINFPKFKELIEWQIAEGTDAIIVCGTTGEATTMSEAEKKDAIKFVVETVNNRIPVIAGTGSNNTAAAIEMSKFSESIGVDGLLVITPYYNKTNKKGLFKHFEAINNAVNTPIILYNVPSRTNMNITPETLLELSELSNVTAVKEASGNISQIAKIKALCGDKLDIYSGNDDQVTAILALGGIGVISVLANIVPKAVHEMVMSYLTGDTNKSLSLQL
uniref:4-hydroxy-tetrahydrodipicolinate synthase n=1 Tax=uncultured Clostridium sp. TaxID=59620 RepID=UPI0025F127BF